MKDQYVGDYNDFVKYALLRAVLAQGLPLLVCWMLTESDGSSDGGKVAYLRQPERFRELDPENFDLMARLVGAGKRSVAAIEASGLLPGARYFPRTLEGDEPPAVVFLDADNGFEVASSRGSPKYVYWDEVANTYGRGHSVIVFQHFAREERSGHIRRLLERLAELTGAQTFALRSANVGFFFAAQQGHGGALNGAAEKLARRWGPRLQLE
jgi:hypothetical protein